MKIEMSRSSIAPLVEDVPQSPPKLPGILPRYGQSFQMSSTPELNQVNHVTVRPAENGNTKKHQYGVTNGNGVHVISMADGCVEDSEKGRSSLDYRTDLDLTFYKALGPLIKCMLFFGIWHGHVVDPVNNPPPKTTFKKIFNSRNYSIVVLILLWFNLLRFIPSFFVGALLDPSRLFAKVIFVAFFIQCALNDSIFFWVLSKKHMMAVFFHHFQVSIQNNPVTAVDVKWLRRTSLITAIVGCCFITAHFLNQTTGALLPIELFQNSSNIFTAPFYPNYPLQILFIIIFLFNFASWIFPLLFFIVICCTLSRQFVLFDHRLEKSLRQARIDGCFPKDFEILRRQHEALATAVDTSNDGMFTFINIITYITMVPLACFLLYQILFSGISGNATVWFMYVVWLTCIFINVCVVSWFAAIVSSKAHDPRERLFMVSLSDITNEEIMQMNVFLNRLSGDPIGYTIFDLVTITKPFILTIGGLAITYYAIIAEFQ